MIQIEKQGGYVGQKHELGVTNFLKKSHLHLPYIKKTAWAGARGLASGFFR
jgi:hypothetical protein